MRVVGFLGGVLCLYFLFTPMHGFHWTWKANAGFGFGAFYGMAVAVGLVKVKADLGFQGGVSLSDNIRGLDKGSGQALMLGGGCLVPFVLAMAALLFSAPIIRLAILVMVVVSLGFTFWAAAIRGELS